MLHLFNMQTTAHLFHGQLLLNIRICCNYPEISSPWLLLNNNREIPGVYTTPYSVRVVFGPSSSRVSSTLRALAIRTSVITTITVSTGAITASAVEFHHDDKPGRSHGHQEAQGGEAFLVRFSD